MHDEVEIGEAFGPHHVLQQGKGGNGHEMVWEGRVLDTIVFPRTSLKHSLELKLGFKLK